MHSLHKSSHLFWVVALISQFPAASAQRNPMENLVLADCGPSGGEMLYYQGDVWTGSGSDTNAPNMHSSMSIAQSSSWGRDAGVSANLPNGDVFTVRINPNIKDPAAAGDAWHRYEIEKPLKCYSYHWEKVYQREDGQWCSSAYVCNHRGKPYTKPIDPSPIPIWNVDPSKVKCSDRYITDENEAPDVRWNASGAEGAFFSASLSWLVNSSTAATTPTRLNYSQYISNYFGGNEQFQCGDVYAGSQCSNAVRCDETNKPAGFHILNSFVAIHNIHSSAYAALGDALNQMQDHIEEFQETFSPAKSKDNNWLKEILDIASLFAGVGSAGLWNRVLKVPFQAENHPKSYGFAKDTFNSAVGFAFALGKDSLTPEDLKKSMKDIMSAMFESWRQTQAAFLQSLFSGTNHDIGILELNVRNGLAMQLVQYMDQHKYMNEALKLVYASMLPLAWKNTSRKIKEVPRQIRPMILMDPQNCITDGDKLSWIVDPKKSKRMAVCYKNLTFFVGFPTVNSYTSNGNPKGLMLWALPGGEKGEDENGKSNPLSGKAWGGLTLDDLVISAFEGYRQNGYKNGYNMSKALEIDPEKAANLVIGEGVREPGFVQLPICTADRVVQESKPSDDWNPGYPDPAQKDPFPCGNGALTSEEMVKFGFK